LRVKGKLIRKSLETDVPSVGKLRLADFEKQNRQRSVSAGRMTVSDAIVIHRRRVAGDASLKPRTRQIEARLLANQPKPARRMRRFNGPPSRWWLK